MACPYFAPEERLPLASGSLGDLYAGRCRADAAQIYQPDERTIADRCNLGYARGLCAHFPAGDGPDAVRFCVSKSEAPGLRILYAMERDHRPYSSGSLDYSSASGAFLGAPPEALARLAHAYVRSYLRRAR
jgi:hypothetical protein